MRLGAALVTSSGAGGAARGQHSARGMGRLLALPLVVSGAASRLEQTVRAATGGNLGREALSGAHSPRSRTDCARSGPGQEAASHGARIRRLAREIACIGCLR